ncbi:hypothetical protein EAL2_c11310 [Peptoclostridium acidaminophilum DSM 3953]|uniref:RES domain-containing protein n=1 Tax=Peptoclostridium acidaminophilum DSM 3953 TaxID=1286171 RepID=W8T3T4_PEPAC|nr:RES family NAD+ phosphorylase [Peptoclostridium acidaminophilum]AHM56429.1 hypothetical protein EAL2_c11310 [Peptoclostridium acidaminophilum DSM 3953]
MSFKEEWDYFKNEVINENRFFAKVPFKKDLDDLICNSKVSVINCDFYRARKGSFNKELDMRAPSFDKVKDDGRCNPKGISYLYTATDANTAIHEVRPGINDVVTVAKFTVEKACCVDFNSVMIDYKDGFRYTEKFIEFTKFLISEFQKPISKYESLEYIPLQYITEYIKKSSERDGFIFKSSFQTKLNKGSNYVFFKDNPEKIIYKGNEKYLITNMNLNHEKLNCM